ncbi:hypothetical protein AB0A05_26805 [Streptomyces sp. NPDC046374]|uniref:hypothetical protein n=1 Tax=Streptomyces sp. NPDC046374 TaxID=3154917 RepID=UPI0033EBD5BA
MERFVRAQAHGVTPFWVKALLDDFNPAVTLLVNLQGRFEIGFVGSPSAVEIVDGEDRPTGMIDDLWIPGQDSTVISQQDVIDLVGQDAWTPLGLKPEAMEKILAEANGRLAKLAGL